MSYPDAASERAMTVQQVMMKALSGEIHWYRAADILGFSARTLRRWRERYEQHGYVASRLDPRLQPCRASVWRRSCANAPHAPVFCHVRGSISLPADPIDTSARPDRIMYQKR